MNPFRNAITQIDTLQTATVRGRVHSLTGLAIIANDLPAPHGALVRIDSREGPKLAEVVAFDGPRPHVHPLDSHAGLGPAAPDTILPPTPAVNAGPQLLGRIINGLGLPIDDKTLPSTLTPQPLHPKPISAFDREPITEQLTTGVRAIDTMTAVGKGQRLGIFAGPGVGKSTLLGMIARSAQTDGGADVNVIALIGERGREVKDFINHALGPEGLERSVVIVATSDQSPVLRLRAANTACAVAEHFRERGKDVMLMLDSVTRYAHAQRQVGLAAGEPPATRGYTPSVFAGLSVLLERAGTLSPQQNQRPGTITAFYTVLVEGDDMTEPVADAARGILDGHIVLDRKIAQAGRFPAIDVLDSVSRVAPEITAPNHQRARQSITSLLAEYRDVEELIRIGAYAPGSSPITDTAVEYRERIEAILRQHATEISPARNAIDELIATAAAAEADTQRRKASNGPGQKPQARPNPLAAGART